MHCSLTVVQIYVEIVRGKLIVCLQKQKATGIHEKAPKEKIPRKIRTFKKEKAKNLYKTQESRNTSRKNKSKSLNMNQESWKIEKE